MTSVLGLASPRVGRAEGPYELNIGTLAPKGTPWMAALEQLEREVEAETGGRINVILRPPGVMGEVEMVREVRIGDRLQGCTVSAGALAEGGNAPLLSLVELPFLFRTDAEVDHVLDDVLFAPMSDELAKRGFVLGSWSENGWRSFATRGAAVTSPADLQRLRMRSQESPVHVEMYRAFGVAPIQKPMTEVLTSLQSGVIDGFDGTALYVASAGLGDAIDHFTVTRHIYQPSVIVWSARWFDRLPPDLQTVLRSKRSIGPATRQALRAEDQAALDRFEVVGVEVHQLTAAQRDAFATVARRIHDPIAAGIEGGPALLAKIRAGIATTPSRSGPASAPP
ncbi:MAG: TRAP transporter substrate-binding protein DctP [Myxococcota bacterium]